MSTDEPEPEEPTRDEDDPEALPEGEHDLAPMGVDEDDHSDQENADQPGLPTEGEPETSG